MHVNKKRLPGGSLHDASTTTLLPPADDLGIMLANSAYAKAGCPNCYERAVILRVIDKDGNKIQGLCGCSTAKYLAARQLVDEAVRAQLDSEKVPSEQREERKREILPSVRERLGVV